MYRRAATHWQNGSGLPWDILASMNPAISSPARWPSRAFLQKYGLTLGTAPSRHTCPMHLQCGDRPFLGHRGSGPSCEEAV